MQIKSRSRTIGVGGAALAAHLFVMGCDFNPINYVGRNACDFLNCDVLFFVDDLLPLSGGPVAAGGGNSGAPDTGSADEGGHAH